MVYTLLIIFDNGLKKEIDEVKDHGIKDGVFYFFKNGHLSYVPAKVVVFFGRAFDWGDES